MYINKIYCPSNAIKDIYIVSTIVIKTDFVSEICHRNHYWALLHKENRYKFITENTGWNNWTYKVVKTA